jgi:hypothetical protein
MKFKENELNLHIILLISDIKLFYFKIKIQVIYD